MSDDKNKFSVLIKNDLHLRNHDKNHYNNKTDSTVKMEWTI